MLVGSERVSSDLYHYGIVEFPKILINEIASRFLIFFYSLALSPKFDLYIEK